MYEFRYPKIAELSADKIESSIAYLVASIENRIEENEKTMTKESRATFEKAINHICSGLNVSINMSELGDNPIDFSIIDKLIADSKIIKRPLKFFVIGSSKFGKEDESVSMVFSQKAIDNLIELNNYLVDRGFEGLNFMEDSLSPENSWTFEEVINANDQIDAIVEYIKEQNFSPFETAAFLHQYITTQYSYKEDNKYPYNSRSIVGVLNTDKIVCVGYSRFMKAVIDKLNMKGLECSTFTSVLTPNGKIDPIFEELNLSPLGTGHMQNIIKINDPKYGVDGRYVSDACWDSKSNAFKTGKGIANFMYPVEDLLHYKSQKFDQPSNVIDQLTKMLGIDENKVDPYSLPVISENIKNSKPIKVEQYKQCLTNLYKILNPKDSLADIERRVNAVIDVSSYVSCAIFTKDAIGSIAKKAYMEFKKEDAQIEKE